MGYPMVIFETDCKEVVDALKHDVPNDIEFGLILRKCHILLCFEPSFTVVHVRRSVHETLHAITIWLCLVQILAIELECPIWLGVHLKSICNLVDHCNLIDH